MDSYEKKALESLKNIDFKQLFMKDTYVEIQINDDIKEAYIDDIKEKEKCLLYIHTVDGRNGTMEFPMNVLNFYQQSDYAEEKLRSTVINFNIFDLGTDKIISTINQKLESLGIHLKNQKNPKKDNNTNIGSSNKSQNIDKNKIIDKNGKSLDIQGYWIYQFFFGYILDCLGLAHIKLNNHNFQTSYKSLLILILDIIIYMIDVVKGNLKKYKTTYFNRRLLIVSKIHGILIGFDTIINNLVNLYSFNFSVDRELNKRFTFILQSIYDIILASKDSCSIPLTSLLIFFKLITFEDNAKQIANYKVQDLYNCLNQHLKNLNENELKNIKKNSDMKREIEYLINNLFPKKELNTLINQTYYCFLLSCLKCKN